MRSMTLEELLSALGVLVAGMLVGLGLRWAFGRLAHRSGRTRWAADEILFDALREAALLAGILIGTWVAVLTLPLSADATRVVGRWLLAAAIVLATLELARTGVRAVAASTARFTGVDRSTSLFVNITRLVVILVGSLVLLQTFGVSITPILTALGVGGLAVVLALQDTLSNLFAGVHILASKKVRPGDFVKLETGEEGYITDINWRNTMIRQLPNNHVIVPNAKFASSIVTNYYRPERELSILVQVSVAYDSDLREVERVTIDVASEVMREVEGGVAEFEPLVRFHTFGESSIGFTAVLRAREVTDQHLLKHEFVKRLQERYRREGIEIPFPIRTVVLKDGRAPRDASSPGGGPNR